MTGFGSVSTRDMKAAIAAIGSIDKGLDKEWRAQAKREIAEPFAEALARQAPSGSKGAAAGRSIKTGTGPLPVILAGKGSWQGWQPFFSLNYGMSHDKFHTYIRRSPRGMRHVVRRRTGTWAPQWKPKHAYWFEPYFDKHLPEQRAKVMKIADDFIRTRLM